MIVPELFVFLIGITGYSVILYTICQYHQKNKKYYNDDTEPLYC